LTKCARSRTAKSCGPDAPTLASSERQCLRIALTMVARKPGRQGEREISRNTIAQGRPECFGVPVVTNSCAFYYAHEAAGAASIRPSPRPHSRGTNSCSTARARLAPRRRSRVFRVLRPAFRRDELFLTDARAAPAHDERAQQCLLFDNQNEDRCRVRRTKPRENGAPGR
jgi:hypothetical protein